MEIIKFEELENKLIKYNEKFVLVDRDVAQLYGVETREINQAVLNNLDKFPQGYIVELKDEEKIELIKKFDRFNKLKHSTVNPKVFTEKGLYMLATIIKSKVSIQTSKNFEFNLGFAKVSRSIKKIKK